MLKLQEAGFTNAYALLGGIAAWNKAELPTDPEPVEFANEHRAN